jgi:hypothetical protein
MEGWVATPAAIRCGLSWYVGPGSQVVRKYKRIFQRNCARAASCKSPRISAATQTTGSGMHRAWGCGWRPWQTRRRRIYGEGGGGGGVRGVDHHLERCARVGVEVVVKVCQAGPAGGGIDAECAALQHAGVVHERREAAQLGDGLGDDLQAGGATALCQSVHPVQRLLYVRRQARCMTMSHSRARTRRAR